MKNPISLIVAILLVAVIALTACGQQSAGDTSPTETPQGTLPDSIFSSAPATEASTAGSTPTEGSESTEASTAPDENPTTGGSNATQTTEPQSTQGASKPEEPDDTMDYETFQAMTPAEQQEFQASFPSIADFFAWYNAAKEQYEQENPLIEIGGNGQVDMGQLGGAKG